VVADQSQTCKLAASELDDRPNSSSLQVCDQLRTCLRLGQRNGIWLLQADIMETAARIGLQLLLHGSLAQGLSDAKNVDEIPVLLLLPTEGGGKYT